MKLTRLQRISDLFAKYQLKNKEKASLLTVNLWLVDISERARVFSNDSPSNLLLYKSECV